MLRCAIVTLDTELDQDIFEAWLDGVVSAKAVKPQSVVVESCMESNLSTEESTNPFSAIASQLGVTLQRVIKNQPLIDSCISTAIVSGQIPRTGTYLTTDGRVIMFAVNWTSERGVSGWDGTESITRRRFIREEGNVFMLGSTNIDMVLEDLSAHEHFERTIWKNFLRDGGNL